MRRNSAFSAAEVIVGGVCLFFIYRNVVQTLGVSMLGVWSLVLATTAFGRAADLGISGGLARFIGRSIGEGRLEAAVAYMRTGVLFMAAAMGVVALALWWPLWRGLAIALDGRELAAAREVLPWAVLSLWLLIVKSAIDSCLLGMGRADLRSIGGMLGMLAQLVASLMLVGTFGLNGLAWAQAGQFVLAICFELGALAIVTNNAGDRMASPWFSGALLREMLGFGVKLQAGSLANLMFEPVVKTALGAVAGTHVLGIFEIAYRMSYQARNVAIMALQPSLPKFAELSVGDQQGLRDLFSRICRAAALMGGGLMLLVAVASPLISFLYLDEVDPLFIYVVGVVSAMWAATIFASPAYYLGIASGRVVPYVMSECVSIAIAGLAVVVVGAVIDPAASIVGIALGKIVGSCITAAWIRPTSRLRDSALLHPDILKATVVVLLCSVTVVLVSLHVR